MADTPIDDEEETPAAQAVTEADEDGTAGQADAAVAEDAEAEDAEDGAEDAEDAVDDEVDADEADADAEDTEEAEDAVDADEDAEADESTDEDTEDDSAAEEAGDGEEAEPAKDAWTRKVDEITESLDSLSSGKWYALHTYSGYEKRVKTNIESRIASLGLQDQIFQVEIPMDEVETYSDKGKKVANRVRYPGYVLVRMTGDEDARRKVRETEGVTGFVGTVRDPIPLSNADVAKMLAPLPRVVEVNYKVGDQVRVVAGPLGQTDNHVVGTITKVVPETRKLTVVADMLGNDATIELDFDNVQKIDD